MGKSHSTIFIHTKAYIFIPLCGRVLGFSIGRLVYKIRNVVKSALLWLRLNALFLYSEYKIRGPLECFLYRNRYCFALVSEKRRQQITHFEVSSNHCAHACNFYQHKHLAWYLEWCVGYWRVLGL